MAEREKSVSVTEFKAHCLSLMDAISARKLTRVNVLKRGKPHVVISAPTVAKSKKSIFGALKGSVVVPKDLDLTKPVFEGDIDAEMGILHR